MFMPARSLVRDERGMSLVFVGIGLGAFVAATALAIDVGMLMTARTQAQNSADGGAHAGAVALAFDDYDNRSASGPAVTNALREAKANQVMGANINAEPEDVEFLNDPDGEPNRVRVTVYRTAGRGNPLNLIIAPIFGIDTASVRAVATAEASPADMPTRCLPFTIPDRWREGTPEPVKAFDAILSTFEMYDKHGVLLTPHDVYLGTEYKSDYTGYSPYADRGTLIRLKTAPDSTVAPSIYNPIVVPGGEGTGADRFREAIVNGRCPNYEDMKKERMIPEPGDMVGATKQGIEELIAKDPYAEYDTGCRCIVGSRYVPASDSPRLSTIPLYNPEKFEEGKHEGRFADFYIANHLGVFVVGMDGKEVLARIMPTPGRRSGDTNIPDGSFLKTVRIVQ